MHHAYICQVYNDNLSINLTYFKFIVYSTNSVGVNSIVWCLQNKKLKLSIPYIRTLLVKTPK
jgi:hypothetical protein